MTDNKNDAVERNQDYDSASYSYEKDDRKPSNEGDSRFRKPYSNRYNGRNHHGSTYGNRPRQTESSYRSFDSTTRRDFRNDYRERPSRDYEANRPADNGNAYNADDYGNRMQSSEEGNRDGRPKRRRLIRPNGNAAGTARFQKVDQGRGANTAYKSRTNGGRLHPRKLKRQGPKPKARKKIEIPDYPDVVFTEPLRLNKYIANTGLCSRRDADEYIKAGRITVNGVIVNELGVKIDPQDEVLFDGKALAKERKIYLLLNKPKGFVTTMEDDKKRKTVMDLVRYACRERIYPVGRLDKMTTGVLLFTNDGELSLKLTHPANKMRKVYQVQLNRPITEEDLQRVAAGVELDDGFIMPDAVAYAVEDDQTQVGIEIHSGRNRVVRRIFDAVGYKVEKLDRVYFAGLSKKGLKRGKWRFLSTQEVAFLKMMPTQVE